MDNQHKNPIAIKNEDGKVIGWISKEEYEVQKLWWEEMQAKWLHGIMYGFPEPTEEEKYLRGIRAVITKERRLVYQHDDGKFYEAEETSPALRIPLVEIKEKLTVERGATGFDF